MTEQSASVALTGEVTARPTRVMVQDTVAIFDTARFEHYGRIAKVMASSSLVPNTLIEGGSDIAVANCFQVVEFADRIGFSPFAVAQCASVVHGRLMFEGKLVAAALQAKVGVDLVYEFGKWDSKTERTIIGAEGEGDALGVVVREKNGEREIHGSVGIWKTSAKGSPWTPGNMKRQLRYRGAREWARAYEPAIMLGVYTDDEMEGLAERRHQAVVSGPRPSLSAGFGEAPPSPEAIKALRERLNQVQEETPTADAASDAQANAGDTSTLTPPQGDAQEEREPVGESSVSSPEPGTQNSSASPEKSGAPSVDGAVNPLAVAMAAISEAKDWPEILAALVAVGATPEWKETAEENRVAVRAAAWEQYISFPRDSGEHRAEITTSFPLMRLWIQAGAAHPEDFDKMWPAFWRSKAYKEASAAKQNEIMRLMIERKTALAAAREA